MKRYLFLLVIAIFCLPNTALAQYHSSNSRLFSSSTTSEREMRDQNRRNNKFFGESKAYRKPMECYKLPPKIFYMKPVKTITDETTGNTTIRWADGSSYVGQIANGKICGIGTMIYPDGSRYCGRWKEELPNGNGSFTSPEGIAFTGKFKNGVPHGKGVIQDLDGRLYSARWVRGVLKEKSIKPIEK